MIRAPVPDLRAGTVRLPDDVAHYLVSVRRMRVGDAAVLFCPTTQREADATLTRVGADGVHAVVGDLREAVRGTLAVTLIYALAKGDKVDKVVQDATELGASAIVIVATERCVVRLDAERGSARRSRWERIALDAARQCGRAAGAEVAGPVALAECEPLLPPSERARRIVLTPEAKSSLGSLLAQEATLTRELVFAIGPEGGFSKEELAWFQANAFTEANLGPRVLRTETAPAAVLGGLQLLLDREEAS